MESLHQKSIVCMFSVFLLVLCVYNCSGTVHEINSATITKFLKDKTFTITFVDSPTCSRCRVLFPFFVAASQAFPHDPEIFFTRTHDKKLIQKWGISELPALIYHRDGFDSHEFLDIDITVDDVINEIARILHGNFEGLTRMYTVHLDDKNYDELVVTPHQSTMILIYDKGQDKSVELMELVARAFRKDDAILFAVLDVNKYKTLRDERFRTRDTPTIMWLAADDKTPKIFGGMHTLPLLVLFVNERTGLNRSPEGAMHSDAGRVPEADIVIMENFEDIMSPEPKRLKQVLNAIQALKNEIAEHHHEMLEFYGFIIDNIAMSGSIRVIREMMNEIESKLFGKEELSTKLQEMLKRRKNILHFFRETERDYADEKKRQLKEELEKKIDKTKKVTLKHSHVHTEL